MHSEASCLGAITKTEEIADHSSSNEIPIAFNCSGVRDRGFLRSCDRNNSLELSNSPVGNVSDLLFSIQNEAVIEGAAITGTPR